MPEIICTKCSPPKVTKSLISWKRHMGSVHGGYDDDDIRAVTGGTSAATDGNVKERMGKFASTLPDVPALSTPPAEGTSTQPTEPAPPAPPAEKRIKATPKKLKKLLGDIPAKILESQNIPIDNDDTEALEEATEMLAGIFGVEFSIPESKYVIHSRLMGVVWVCLVYALIYVKHKTPQVWALFSNEKAKAEKKSVEQNSRDSGTEGQR